MRSLKKEVYLGLKLVYILSKILIDEGFGTENEIRNGHKTPTCEWVRQDLESENWRIRGPRKTKEVVTPVLFPRVGVTNFVTKC